MGDRPLGSRAVFLKPKRELWRSTWVVCIMLTCPVFFSLYLLSAENWHWVQFAVAHAAVILLVAVAAIRLKGAGIHLRADGIREREYFRRAQFTPVERISSVIVLTLRDSSSDEVSRQLFMVDGDGRTVLRMRGQMWRRVDFNQAIQFYGVPVMTIEETMSWPALRQRFGRNLVFWERHPYLANTALAVGFVVVTVPLLLAVLGSLARIE